MIVLKKTLNDVKEKLESAEEEIAFLSRFKLDAESKILAIENAVKDSLNGKIGKARAMKSILSLLADYSVLSWKNKDNNIS